MVELDSNPKQRVPLGTHTTLQVPAAGETATLQRQVTPSLFSRGRLTLKAARAHGQGYSPA